MQAIFERKPSDFCLQDFEVSKTIRLPVEVFEDVLKNPIRDYDFIRENIDLMESEAGVKIRNSQEIIEVYEEQLFIFHSELQEYLRFRNDLEIGEYKSIENDTGILFEIRYKVNDESAIVSYSIECMDDSQGSESVVAVNIMVGENVFSKDIAYTNGEISFNSHQSCYMPETQDSISMEDLSALKEGAVDFLNEQFENLREKVDSEMFSIIKDGGSSPLAEFS